MPNTLEDLMELDAARVKSRLDSNTAAQVYEKLKDRLAVELKKHDGYKPEWLKSIIYLEHPAIGNDPTQWSLVRWMPKLEQGWARMSFHQFLALYHIPVVDFVEEDAHASDDHGMA